MNKQGSFKNGLGIVVDRLALERRHVLDVWQRVTPTLDGICVGREDPGLVVGEVEISTAGVGVRSSVLTHHEVLHLLD